MRSKTVLAWAIPILGGCASVGVGIAAMMAPVRAGELQKWVDSIESVDVVKQDLKRLLEESDTCRVGSCFNTMRSEICEQVAALDVQVNGQIIGDWVSVGDKGKIPISPSDLRLMKDIFSQCKPTNYQYWNFSRMLHVYYVPTPTIDRQVRKALGVMPKGNDRR